MPLTQEEKLRQLLGESVPAGGSASDTLFTTEEVVEFLDDNPEDIERAAYDGWRAKAAKLSSLVDTTEGNSQKKFSQLLDNAETMIKIYSRSSPGPTEGRTRIGRATRPPMEW